MKDKADYIISLIGTNPLPSFLTFIKNCAPSTKVFLIYTPASEHNIASKNVAKNLESVFKSKIDSTQLFLKECDKSHIKFIDEVIKDILDYITKDMESGEQFQKERKLILDYSSGTKVMSVIFFNRLLNQNIEGINIVASYLDDDNERFIESRNNNISETRHSIKDILEVKNIDIKDIIKIHGYDFVDNPFVKTYKTENSNEVKYIDNEVRLVKQNNKEIIISVDSLALLYGRLIIYYCSKYKNENKSKYKRELFEVKDIAEKLGGSRSKFVYKCDYDERKFKDLKRDLRREYEYEMEKRFVILNNDESFIDYIKRL